MERDYIGKADSKEDSLLLVFRKRDTGLSEEMYGKLAQVLSGL